MYTHDCLRNPLDGMENDCALAIARIAFAECYDEHNTSKKIEIHSLAKKASVIVACDAPTAGICLVGLATSFSLSKGKSSETFKTTVKVRETDVNIVPMHVAPVLSVRATRDGTWEKQVCQIAVPFWMVGTTSDAKLVNAEYTTISMKVKCGKQIASVDVPCMRNTRAVSKGEKLMAFTSEITAVLDTVEPDAKRHCAKTVGKGTKGKGKGKKAVGKSSK